MSSRRRGHGPQDAQPAQGATRLPGAVRRALRWVLLGAAGCLLGWGLAVATSPATASAATLDCPGSTASTTASAVRTLDDVVSGLVEGHGDTSTSACRPDPSGKTLLDTRPVTDGLVRPAADRLSRPLRPVTRQVGHLVDRAVDGVTDPQPQLTDAGTTTVPVAAYEGPGTTGTPDKAAASHRRDGVATATHVRQVTDAAGGTREQAPDSGAKLPAGHAPHGDAGHGYSGHHGVPTVPHGADNTPSSGSGAGGGNGGQACTVATATAPATHVVCLAPSGDDELPSNAAGKPRVSPD